MALAFGVAASFLLFVEFVKFGKVWPFGEYIQGFQSVFLNEKDQAGAFALSPLYLVLGCAFPVWIGRSVVVVDDLKALIP